MAKGIEGKIVLILVLIFLLAELAYAGTVTGTVSARLKVPKDILVYVEKVEEEDFSPPKAPAKIELTKLVFTPRVLPVLKGTTVEFHNSDNVTYDVSGAGDDAFSLGAQKSNEAKTYSFNKPGVVAISSNTHPEMEGYVVVSQNPYFALTDEKGKYRIKDVTPGKYKLKTWHDRLKSVTKEIQVPEQGEVVVDFDLLTYAGTIMGKVSTKRLKTPKDILVYIEKVEGEEFPVPAESPIMDQVKLVFIPSVIPVVVGTTVGFRNSDNVLHNVFAVGDDEFNLGTWKGEEVQTHTFNKLGEVAILCNVHPEMEAYVVVLQNPYFALTDEKGKYRIKDVTPGKYKLKTWHHRLGSVTEEVEVPIEGGVIIADFELKR